MPSDSAGGRGAREKDSGQFDEIEEVPAGTACSMIIRREALNGEPLFDGSLFMYYEEFELSLRIREAGYRIVYAPSSIVHHRRNQSVKKEHSQPNLFCQFHGNRNRVKILAKYYPAGVLLANSPLDSGEPGLLEPVLSAQWWIIAAGEGHRSAVALPAHGVVGATFEPACGPNLAAVDGEELPARNAENQAKQEPGLRVLRQEWFR